VSKAESGTRLANSQKQAQNTYETYTHTMITWHANYRHYNSNILAESLRNETSIDSQSIRKRDALIRGFGPQEGLDLGDHFAVMGQLQNKTLRNDKCTEIFLQCRAFLYDVGRLKNNLLQGSSIVLE
jgi:hypothetical protein